MNGSIVWPGVELHVERQEIPVGPGSEPDPDWRFVDAEGHGHFWQDAEDNYPTLRWMQLPCSMGHGEDCTAEGAYRCRRRPSSRTARPWRHRADNYGRAIVTVPLNGFRVTRLYGPRLRSRRERLRKASEQS